MALSVIKIAHSWHETWKDEPVCWPAASWKTFYFYVLQCRSSKWFPTIERLILLEGNSQKTHKCKSPTEHRIPLYTNFLWRFNVSHLLNVSVILASKKATPPFYWGTTGSLMTLQCSKQHGDNKDRNKEFESAYNSFWNVEPLTNVSVQSQQWHVSLYASERYEDGMKERRRFICLCGCTCFKGSRLGNDVLAE